MIAVDNFITKAENIVFNKLKCLRFDTSLHHCTLCKIICPTDAFTIRNMRMELDWKKCIHCSACIGVCPSESLSDESFNPNEFSENYKQRQNSGISCQNGDIPCIGTLNEYQLAIIGLNNKDGFYIDITKCKECQINSDNNIVEYITSTIKKTDSFLTSIEQKSEITILTDYLPNTKRVLFRKVVDKITLPKREDKRVSIKSIQLHQKIKDLELPEQLENSLMIFEKTVEKTCDFCEECVKFCPTNSLTMENLSNEKILFQSIKDCIDCGICELICKKNSISKNPTTDLLSYKENKPIVLAKSKTKICKECKCAYYGSKNDDYCERCITGREITKDMFVLAKDL